MRGEVNIHELGPDEWGRFRAIRLRSLAEAPLAFGTTLAEAQAIPRGRWPAQLAAAATFVARLDDDPVDVGVVRLAPDRTDARVGWLISMWVAPEARGRGVGDALVRTVLQRARELGHRRVCLDVADMNLDAVFLYARHGFRATGETGTHRPPRQHVREHRREVRLA